jgi:hypothetical protein
VCTVHNSAACACLRPCAPDAQISWFYPPWFYLYITHERSVPRHFAFSTVSNKKAGMAGDEATHKEQIKYIRVVAHPAH